MIDLKGLGGCGCRFNVFGRPGFGRKPIYESLPGTTWQRLPIDAKRNQGEIPLQPGEFATARLTSRDVQANGRRLFCRESLKRVERQVVLRNVLPFPHASSLFRRLFSAVRILVFTVPSGWPVFAAISACVNPSKNAISNEFCCSGGN